MDNEQSYSDAELEIALRAAVRRIYAEGNLEDLTVKRVRVQVERENHLRTGFFKSAKWKSHSKLVIEEQAQRCDSEIANDDKASPAKPPNQATPESAKTAAPIRKRKLVESIEYDEEEVDVRPQKRRPKSKVIVLEDEDQARPGEISVGEIGNNETVLETVDDLRDSELSEVLDEHPVRKAKRKKKSVVPSKSKAESKSRTKQSKSTTIDPQVEEIKSLQGWLAKCGIRKVWGKYLKPFEAPQEKINHLKKMLTEVGMTGRYSKEKAESIREAREIAADVEAVQAGDKAWGMESDDVPGRSVRRRTVR